MNVTIICDVLGEPNNGTVLATLNLIRYLTEKGHKVTVVSPDRSTEGQENYYVVPTLNLGSFLNRVVERNGVQLAKADKEILVQAIREADVVHVEVPLFLGCAAVKLAKSMGKPLTASFHCQAENVTAHLGMMNFPPANNLTYKVFYRNVFGKVDKIHYPTRFIREVFENKTKPTDGVVISNGVNDIFFEPHPPKRLSEKFTVVCTGRYCKEKSQITLIRALSKCKHKDEIKVVFAGEGPDGKKLAKKAEKLGADCEFRFFKREEFPAVLRGADLYVHTAVIEIEAIACMEAIVSGLVPVICNSERSATRFFALDERNLYKKADPDDLAEKLDFWYENRALREEYSKRYEDMRKSFSQKACMEQMEQMLLNVIEEHQEKTDSVCGGKDRKKGDDKEAV